MEVAKKNSSELAMMLQNIRDNTDEIQKTLSDLKLKVQKIEETGQQDPEDMDEIQRKQLNYKETRRDKR